MTEMGQVEAMILNRMILAIDLVAKTFVEYKVPIEDQQAHMNAAIAKHTKVTLTLVQPIVDMVSTACLFSLVPSTGVVSCVASGSASSASSSSTRRVVMASMPLTFVEFSRFSSVPDDGSLPVLKADYVVCNVLYNSSSYRTKVTSKDAQALSYTVYKDERMAAFKARGVCFDKAAFMEKAAPLNLSIKKRSHLWFEYCICRDLLLGFKRFKPSSSAEGRPVKRRRTSGPSKLSLVAAASLKKINDGDEEEAEEEEEDESEDLMNGRLDDGATPQDSGSECGEGSDD